jgi:hypothetical protein
MIGCKSFDHLTRVENSFPQAKSCNECHVEIHAEWAGSGHAHAFTGEDFQAVTFGGTIADCTSCHAPEPYLVESSPMRRAVVPKEGVTCTTCHLSEAKMLGPIQPTGLVQPHPIEVRSAQYNDSAFCARCHQGTFEQWRQSSLADKQSCQECHMPRIDRKVTQATDSVSSLLVSFEKSVPQRIHTFAIPSTESAKGMFELNASFSAGQVAIDLVNRTPHALPTGDYGFQIGVVEVSYLASINNEIRQDRAELVQELKTQLPSGQSKRWTFDLPPTAARVKVRLLRCGRSQNDVMELVAKEVTVP